MFKSLKRKPALYVIALMLVLSLIGCSSKSTTGSTEKSSSKASKEKVTLRLSEAQADKYPDSIAEKAFAKRVSDLSDGRITIDVYTGGELGDEVTTVEQTQVGVIDIGRANAGPLTQFAKKFGVFSFPFLFDSREHMWKALNNSLRDDLFADLENANLIGLAFYDAGARNFYTKEPVTKVEDLKNKKIRVMQNDILIDAFKRLGTSPTPISASEVYSGLQMGVIEGGENNVSTYVTDGHYEIAKNFTLSEHLRIPGVLFMSKTSWDKLSSEDQKIIKKAALESEKTQLKEFDKYAQVSMDKVKANGNNVIKLSDKERNRFRELIKPLYKQYDAQFGSLFKEIDNAR